MDYCVYCGSEIQEGDELCQSCGAEVLSRRPSTMLLIDEMDSEFEEEVDVKSKTSTIVLPKVAANDPHRRVLSATGFLASLAVLIIPVIGQLVALVWALGGCINHNRRNLARAAIYIQIILLALFVGIFMLVKTQAPDFYNAFMKNLDALLF